MTLPGVSFWKLISWTNSEGPLDVTPAFLTTVLSSSYAQTDEEHAVTEGEPWRKKKKKWPKVRLQERVPLFPGCTLACR